MGNLFVATHSCFCEKNECFAYKDGKCVALSDNQFGKRGCPFYKTNSQLAVQRVAVEKRLSEIRTNEEAMI